MLIACSVKLWNVVDYAYTGRAEVFDLYKYTLEILNYGPTTNVFSIMIQCPQVYFAQNGMFDS